MAKFTYVITDEVGLHARPAGLLVKKAKELGAKITLHVMEKQQMLQRSWQSWLWEL